MSVLNKKPFINSVLGSFTSDQVKTLSDLMNGLGNRTELLRIWGYAQGNRTPITTSDKGIHLCSLQVGPTLYRGYLLYNNSYCVLLSFTDFQSLSIFNIDIANNVMSTVSEYLDINELRRCVNELLIEGGVGDYVSEEELQEALIADKDIISKIVKEYDEDHNLTYFKFPNGIVLLNITLNTHKLFFKNGNAVDYQGNLVEGYELSEIVVTEEENYIAFNGDLSEQVINGLNYIAYSGNGLSVNNTYNLFYPATGTKLYKHVINVTRSSDDGFYTIYLISNYEEKYINSYHDLMIGDNFICGVLMSEMPSVPNLIYINYIDIEVLAEITIGWQGITNNGYNTGRISVEGSATETVTEL